VAINKNSKVSHRDHDIFIGTTEIFIIDLYSVVTAENPINK
jgi:hypothetical protein